MKTKVHSVKLEGTYKNFKKWGDKSYKYGDVWKEDKRNDWFQVHLESFIEENKIKSAIDYGGGIGGHSVCGVDWHVVEQPIDVNIPGVKFHTSLSEFSPKEVELIYSNGSLHMTPTIAEDLMTSMMNLKPKYILLHRVIVTEGEDSFITWAPGIAKEMTIISDVKLKKISKDNGYDLVWDDYNAPPGIKGIGLVVKFNVEKATVDVESVVYKHYLLKQKK